MSTFNGRRMEKLGQIDTWIWRRNSFFLWDEFFTVCRIF
jgi:hypothetical protein